jgi:hypothetical protein
LDVSVFWRFSDFVHCNLTIYLLASKILSLVKPFDPVTAGNILAKRTWSI